MKFARCEQSFQCQVIAVSGKAKAEGDYLKSIGASQVNKEQLKKLFYSSGNPPPSPLRVFFAKFFIQVAQNFFEKFMYYQKQFLNS